MGPMSHNPDQPTTRHPSALAPGSRLGRRRRTRWIFMAGVVAMVGLLTALFSFGLSRDPTIVRSALIGREAPGFSLRTLDGTRTFKLSDFRGQVVVVNFWASWCADCLIEHGALAAAWQRYQDQGLVFVGIPFQDAPSASRTYLTSYGGDWPQLADPGSAIALHS